MQLPQENAALIHFRRDTAYACRQFRTAGRSQFADGCKAAFTALREAAAAVEVAEEPVQEALADRDAADALLDPVVEQVSRGLGARSPDAKRTAPWTLIFPDAAAYYTVAPVGEEVHRYTQFAERLQAHLPANDPLLATALPAVRAGLDKWKGAEESLRHASVVLEAARSRREKAEADWRTFMDRLYANLRAELGKDAAERFFRKAPRKSSRREDAGEA